MEIKPSPDGLIDQFREICRSNKQGAFRPILYFLEDDCDYPPGFPNIKAIIAVFRN